MRSLEFVEKLVIDYWQNVQKSVLLCCFLRCFWEKTLREHRARSHSEVYWVLQYVYRAREKKGGQEVNREQEYNNELSKCI